MIPPWATAWRVRVRIDRAKLHEIAHGNAVSTIILGERHINISFGDERRYELTGYEWWRLRQDRDVSPFRDAVLFLDIEHRDETCLPWIPVAFEDADRVYAESVARRREHEQAQHRKAAIEKATAEKAAAQGVADVMAQQAEWAARRAQRVAAQADKALAEVES